MSYKLLAAIVFLTVLSSHLALAESTALEIGQDFFYQNRPAEAIVYLEEARVQEPESYRAIILLGLAYQQLAYYEKAAEVLEAGLSRASDKRDQIYFNLGNVFFVMGRNLEAEAAYTQAITINSQLADAFLNRANARMKREQYSRAAEDYKQYLELYPLSPQALKIQQLLILLAEQESLTPTAISIPETLPPKPDPAPITADPSESSASLPLPEPAQSPPEPLPAETEVITPPEMGERAPSAIDPAKGSPITRGGVTVAPESPGLGEAP